MARKILWDREGAEADVSTPALNIPSMGKVLYFFPNRPTLIPPDKKLIDSLQATNKFIAEKKYNGDNILIDTTSFTVWNRYKQIHKYLLPPEVKAEIQKWPRDCLINAELMNNRTKTIKDMIYVHCVMVWKGSPLIGKTLGDSRNLIETLQYGDHCKLSPIWNCKFWDLFQEADGKIIEGIILKDPKGKLIFSTTPLREDVSWMKKVRKPREGVYNF